MIREHSAGGVVYCLLPAGLAVLLIRDRYGRWTLPKGGIEKGETPEAAALREIDEETGVKGAVEQKLGSTRYWYTNLKGEAINKTVDYFLVKGLTQDLTPAEDEIDEARWIPVNQVLDLEGYANNRAVVEKAVDIIRQLAE